MTTPYNNPQTSPKKYTSFLSFLNKVTIDELCEKDMHPIVWGTTLNKIAQQFSRTEFVSTIFDILMDERKSKELL